MVRCRFPARRAARSCPVRPHAAIAGCIRNACGCHAGAGPRPVARSGPRRSSPAAAACARTVRRGCRAPAARLPVPPRCNPRRRSRRARGACAQVEEAVGIDAEFRARDRSAAADGHPWRSGSAMRAGARRPRIRRCPLRPAGRAVAAARSLRDPVAAGSWRGCWRCNAGDARRRQASRASATRRAGRTPGRARVPSGA